MSEWYPRDIAKNLPTLGEITEWYTTTDKPLRAEYFDNPDIMDNMIYRMGEVAGPHFHSWLRFKRAQDANMAMIKVVNAVRVEFLKELKGDAATLPNSIRNAYLEYNMAEQQGFKE